MIGGLFIGITIAILAIIRFEWPKLKGKPLRDRATFASLLALAWALSMLDLPHTPGPTHALMFIFKPFKSLLEK